MITRGEFDVLRRVLTRYVHEHMSDMGQTIALGAITVRVDVDRNRLRVSTDQWAVTLMDATTEAGAPVKFSGARAAFESDVFVIRLSL